MTDQHAAFVGSIPTNYDRYLGPLFFHGYADDLAARVPVSDGVRVLEVACGTGIVTERIARRVHGRGSLEATDLNEAMLAHAQRRLGPRPGVEWRQADGTRLPFEDGVFDVVVCQFGLMFFPDTAAGVAEAFRVLRPGGRYLLNVWDVIERNPVARIAHETATSFFPVEPPGFYRVPFSLHDPAGVTRLLEQARFANIAWEYVEKTGTSPSATEAATGIIEGNPIYDAIMQRRPDALAEIEAAVAGKIAAELGDHPVRCPMRALVFSARRP